MLSDVGVILILILILVVDLRSNHLVLVLAGVCVRVQLVMTVCSSVVHP